VFFWVMSIEKEIREAGKKKKLLIGSRVVIKALKNGKLKAVVYAKNCPEERIKDLNYYEKISKIKVIAFNDDSKRLGQVCGKPFNILMVGISK